jgi:hypothetical protein
MRTYLIAVRFGLHLSVLARFHAALFKTGTALWYLWTADRQILPFACELTDATAAFIA